VFLDDEGQKVELQAKGEGESASLEVRAPDGTMRLGAGAGQLPSWIPAYPGAEETGQFGFAGKEGNAGSYAFKTSDSAGAVVSFFEEGMKGEGFEVQRILTQTTGTGSGTVLVAKDAASKRNAQITVGSDGSSTSVNIIFSVKD